MQKGVLLIIKLEQEASTETVSGHMTVPVTNSISDKSRAAL